MWADAVDTMDDCADETWQWYRQYSHAPSDTDDRTSKVFFNRVTPEVISEFESEFGSVLPTAYKAFLLEIGCGYIKQDIASNISDTFDNIFLDPQEIGQILRKETEDWDVYADFIADNEVPFFRVDANSVFVFQDTSEAVFFPWNGPKYANSLKEFASRLRVDCNFYTQIT